MKSALMAEPGGIGNDEPWNRHLRLISEHAHPPAQKREETMISVRSTVRSTDFGGARASRWIFAAVAVAALVAPDVADARPARMPQAGAYDGTWNVLFATERGNCSSSNSFPFAVSGTRVSSAGGGTVTGGVSRSGIVSVNVSVGASKASGSGRLVGSSGTGRWSGIITGDHCSGHWRATRS
jgi:hypothetical protein